MPEGVFPVMDGGGGALGHAGVHKVLKSVVSVGTVAKPIFFCFSDAKKSDLLAFSN